MNTLEIESFLRRNCSRDFQGVYSVDTLPDQPKLLVCNTDPSTKPGKHWIAIYVDKRGRGEYFDSFGRPPSTLFRRYLDKHCKTWIFNRRQLQSVLSRFCGYYCCLFCVLRCRGVDMRRIVCQFPNDTSFNDVLVHSFVCKNKVLKM